MDTSEDDSALNIEYYMSCFENDHYTKLMDSKELFKDMKISFGFMEQSKNNFYIVESIKSAKIKVKNVKFLEISYKLLEKKVKFSINLIENIPTMIHMKEIREGSNPSPYRNAKNMTVISFSLPPKFVVNGSEEPSRFLCQNLNVNNNLIVLDCPFRHILLENVNDNVISVLRSKIFFSARNEFTLDSLTIKTYSDYIAQIHLLEDSIARNANNEFYSMYISYANITENLRRRKLETVCSLYEKFLDYFKIKKYSRKDQNPNGFFILKHIQVTPSTIKIKKEIFHQSSRFLRLYFNNDNFLKVEFKDENDSQLYNNTVYTKNIQSLYELVFKQGINLCGRKYVFFLNPTNSMRANSIWMLEENESKLKQDFYYRELGLYSLIHNPSLSFSKLLSRLSQNFTSTLSYNKPFSSTVIEDLKTPDGKSAYNDGCGMISYDLMKDACDELNKGEFSSAIQVRYRGAKGVLVVSPNLRGKQVVLTKSMVKFECDNTNDLEIIRFSKYSPGYLNLQIIILLILNGISKKVIYRFAKKEVGFYRFNKARTYNQPQLEKIINDIQKQDTILRTEKDHLTKIARSTFIYNRLSNISKKYRFHMKNCAFLIGVCDFDNILKEDEVFVQICKPNGKKTIITGDLIVTKNPCLSVYDLQKVKGIRHPFFEKMFYNIIVFPARGTIPLPSKITGSDLDGDVYWVCWEQSLLHIKQRDYYKRCKILKNEEKIPEDPYIILPDGRKYYDIYERAKTMSFQPDPSNSFFDKCLGFHKYFHENYKLPEVNKKYLSYISSLMKEDGHKRLTFRDLITLDLLAFYHSVEVDFQKTGETSTFRNDLIQPTFLKKRELRKKMNFLVKIKEIYDEYKHGASFGSKGSSVSASRTNSFYDFFNASIEGTVNEMNHKFLRLYQKKEIDQDMYTRSFIFKIYELVSYVAPMKEAFYSSLYLMSEEFFYDSKLYERRFSFPTLSSIQELKSLLAEVKEIVRYYESEMKYIMMENEIVNEVELVYLTDFIEPRIAIFKNDIEDYKINLNEQIHFLVFSTKQKLKGVSEKYKLSKEAMEEVLLILIFWVKSETIIINDKTLDLSEVLERKNEIKNIREFMEGIGKQNSVDNMKFYFFDRFKSISLYNFYSK